MIQLAPSKALSESTSAARPGLAAAANCRACRRLAEGQLGARRRPNETGDRTDAEGSALAKFDAEANCEPPASRDPTARPRRGWVTQDAYRHHAEDRAGAAVQVRRAAARCPGSRGAGGATPRDALSSTSGRRSPAAGRCRQGRAGTETPGHPRWRAADRDTASWTSSRR